MSKPKNKCIEMEPEEYFSHLIKYIKQNEILSISREEKTSEVFTDNTEPVKEILNGREIITIEIYNEDKDKTK